jgi:adenylylsulfate kinase
MIILIFGQPASGKTTLSEELADRFLGSDYKKNIVKIDGDAWREVTKNKDYSREGRMANLKGAFDMAIYLDRQGFTCILSFVTPYAELRQYLSENAKTIQVYLEYNEDRGRNNYFVKEFEEPDTKDCLCLNTSNFSIPICVDKIINHIISNS